MSSGVKCLSAFLQGSARVSNWLWFMYPCWCCRLSPCVLDWGFSLLSVQPGHRVLITAASQRCLGVTLGPACRGQHGRENLAPTTSTVSSWRSAAQCHWKSTGTPWSLNSAGLRTAWFLNMEKKQAKCWLCKRQHWWGLKKAIAARERGGNQTVLSSHLMWLNKRHIYAWDCIQISWLPSILTQTECCLVPSCP